MPACTDARRELILASTTSTQDSGLLDELIPAFERAHTDVTVKTIAVGSGEALALGRRRDADVLLVHSPEEEAMFMTGGHGMRRSTVMFNDYVVVGPASDPARVRGASSARAAFMRIAAARAPFISRGDSSGTHRRELRLWAESGVTDEQRARVSMEVGQGMGEALTIASERAAYTLSDRSTHTTLSGHLRLEILVEGDAALQNPYSVITVRSARNGADAERFAAWLTSGAGAAVIRQFGVARFGRQLFFPAADPSTR